MSLVGYTSGGSPIFHNNPKSQHKTRQGKPLFDCSADPRHRLTQNQAKSTGYFCNHCGAPLKARAHKIAELEALARSLGFDVVAKAEGRS